DPQQRLLMELSYEALDDAGQIKENISGTRTGVFIGISSNEYSQLQFDDTTVITSHSGTGSALSIAANRISYFFNLLGPSLAVDTACSSSLTAVHLACQSIRNGECSMALAGGVNIILSPANSIAFTKAGVLAPDGRCKTFDSRANGYVRGEGGGVVVLKKLSAALADGDPVHALLLGSAIGQDGRTNGLMAPSAESQEALLREAYKSAGISPNSIQYIETHGTGTLLGDSMEAKALGVVLGADRINGPCLVGSVKTNIGHLEAAAGIAGLIKVILSIKHKTIPKSLHYLSPNPHIPFQELNLKVNSGLSEWTSGAEAAIAGVSSFGFGGTNVHLIVSEARNAKGDIHNQDAEDIGCNLLPLSAGSPEALRSVAHSFLKLLAPESEIAAIDICHAAGLRRSQFNYRLAVTGNSRDELFFSLQSFIQGEQDANLFSGNSFQQRHPKLVFVFSGQGGQWFGMGRDLLKQEAVFYKEIEQIDLIIQGKLGWSLMDELSAEETSSRLKEIDIVQPVLFAIQVALVKLFESWGIKPEAVAGHSMGEVAAAHVAGVLELEDAVQVVCGRSRVLKQLKGRGSMLATELSPSQANEIIKEYGEDITLAVINSQTSTVLSGNAETIKKVMDTLEKQNVFCKPVNVDVASHSPQIDTLRSDLQIALASLKPQPARLPIYSTVTGRLANDLNFDADYWIDNLRKPVHFSDCVNDLLKDGYTAFIEIGPHPVLLSSIQQSLNSRNSDTLLLPSMRRDEPGRKQLQKTLAALYTAGFSINWNKLYQRGANYVPLPLIPWNRQRYWIEKSTAGSRNKKPNSGHVHALLGERINLANAHSTFVWQTVFDEQLLQMLGDHKVDNETVFPAAGYIEMALQAANETGLHLTHELTDFVISKKMILHTGQAKSVQVIVGPDKNDSLTFGVYSSDNGKQDWALHASATFTQKQTAIDPVASDKTSTDRIRKNCKSDITAEQFYQALSLRGLQYGPSFRGIKQLWKNEREVLGLISLPASLQQDGDEYQIHPVLMDSCLQVLAAMQNNLFENDIYLPTGFKTIRFYAPPGRFLWSHVSLKNELTAGSDVINADIRLTDEDNRVVAELFGFRLQRTGRRIQKPVLNQESWLYKINWRPDSRKTATANTQHEKKHWLIFADGEGVAEQLANQLEKAGDSCHMVFYNEAITDLNDNEESALRELIEKHLLRAGSPLYGIIHLWSLSIPVQSAEFRCTSDAMRRPGCDSALLLVQTLARRMSVLPRLWFVTRGAQSVIPDEAIAVEQSALWGFAKVISLEFPELKCVRIDLDRAQSTAESIPHLVNQLFIDGDEDQLAFRSGTRYVPRLQPFTQAVLNAKPANRLRSDATYLITGGLGALGLKTAEWLVKMGARHLVLLGRNQPSPLAKKITDQLRQEGIEIVLARADVSDPDQ
ncbi:MAG TPA: type I polyketide synthase, partial [Chitinophagaceae bacterium]